MKRPRFLIVVAIAYALFVVFGSLVPLRYQARPIAEAWHTFVGLQAQAPGGESRSDWAANLVLLVPLPFLWLSVWDPRDRKKALVASTLVWFLCLVFSIGVEFAQVYFPPRVPSIRDIVAQGIGSAAGIACWWWWGAAFRQALERWRTAHGPARIAQAILLPYVVGIFLYNLMPLDLTLSPVAVFQKWKEGRVVVAPFDLHGDDPATRLYSFATDIFVWAPVAALTILSGRRSASAAWATTVAAATVLEGAQLFVYSRVSDVNDILTAMVGAGVGAWAGATIKRRIEGRTGEASAPARAPVLLLGSIGALVWIFVLAAAFWYPFDFRPDRAFALSRLPMLRRVPFESYWTGSEFLALTELLQKVLLFAPLGAALAFARGGLRTRGSRLLAGAFAVAVIFAVACCVELGQVFLPGKVPDSTDVLLEASGGILGLWLVTSLQARMRPRATASGS